MSQNKLAKLRNTDVFKALMRVLEDYRIPKEDYDVLDKRPHPMLTVRYCGVEREMSIPSTPKTRGKAPVAYSGQLRRMLKEMQMESLGGSTRRHIKDASEGGSKVRAVSIAGSEIRRVEYRGQQVVTYAMIDHVHKRPEGTAKRSFDENRARFLVGEDFYELGRDEIRTDLPDWVFSKFAPKGFLITKRGYLKIAKTLGDDRAWEVFDEMLQRYFAIEKSGETQFSIPQTFAEALRLAAKQAEQIEKQSAVILDMTPKAEFHDDVAVAINAQTFRDTAHVIGTGQNRLISWLRTNGFLMKTNRPYQRYEDCGYFQVVERRRKDPQTGESIIYPKTLVTGKGLIYFQKKWLEDHQEQGSLL